MGNKAYIILAHKNPSQLQRLIRALDDGLSHFFVHIDRRTGIGPFHDLLQPQTNISFLPQIKTGWGSFGLVEAVLSGLKAVLQPGKKLDHIILLSGQDYPIKSNEQISTFLGQNKDKAFLEYFPLPCPAKWSPNGGLYRVNKYFLGLTTHRRYAAKGINFMATLFPFLQRKMYAGMHAFAGSMWWIISDYAARYIMDFIAENPRYLHFHRFTFAPDELFFHMILLNAKDEQISTAIVNDDKRYIRWKDISASHPEIIKKEDLDELIYSDALFARKFDTVTDEEILDLIDTHCRSEKPRIAQVAG
jgi:hypothetical protein